MTTLSRRSLLLASAAAVPAVMAGRADAAVPVTTGTVPKELAKLDTMMKEFISARSISCAQLAVTRRGKLVLARGYGRYVANRMLYPVRPTTPFRLASLSKHITCAAIMRLAQDGKLSLSAPITTLLGLPTDADPRLAKVTVLRLMQNLGGYDKAASGKDYLFSDHAISAALDVPLPITMEHILKYATSRPLDYDPGTRMSYNNFNFTLLGRVIEKVSGQPYESYVKQNVLGPAGLTRPRLSKSLPTGEVTYNSKYTAKTVLDDSGKVVPYPYGGANYANLDSAAGWAASAVDLVRFSRVFDGATSVLTPASIAALFAKPEIGENANGSWYTGGWWVRSKGGGLNTWHTGSLPGTFTLLTRTYSGISFACTFNRREEEGSPDFDAFHDELYFAAMGITTWPSIDLTAQYL